MDIMIIKNFELCYGCGVELKKSSRKRIKPCLCMTCRGEERSARTNSISFKELNKNAPPPPTAEELIEIKKAWQAQNLKVDHFDKVVR